MNNLATLLQRVKSRIRDKAKPFILKEMRDSIILFICFCIGYLIIPKNEFLQHRPSDPITFSKLIVPILIVITLMGIFVNFSQTLRASLTWVKMKWFDFQYLYLSMLDSYPFSDNLKLTSEENKALFEIHLTQEALLHFMKCIEKNGCITHDDLQYVYNKMQISDTIENNTLFTNTVKEFFEKNNIDVNTISTVDTLSAFKDKPVQHIQAMNGKRDVKKIL